MTQYVVRDKEQNLLRAIKAYREALKVRALSTFPIGYAATQNNLGNAYASIAEVRDREQNLQGAIQAYREALKVYSLSKFPISYGGVNFNLGTVYLNLGEAELRDTKAKAKALEKAKAAFKESIRVFEQENMEDWLDQVQDALDMLKKATL